MKQIHQERQDYALDLQRQGYTLSDIAARIERLDGDGCVSLKQAHMLILKAKDRETMRQMQAEAKIRPNEHNTYPLTLRDSEPDTNACQKRRHIKKEERDTQTRAQRQTKTRASSLTDT